MECRWQVEIDPFCQQVLAKHWPEVKRYGDITKLDGTELEPVDLICGGFPCQDVSIAGFRSGLDGNRSGLWADMLRIVRDVRPRYVLVENVSGLLVPTKPEQPAPIARVLGDLASGGFDAEWSRFLACSVGAPHMRPRVFILAYANGIDGSPRLRDSVERAFRSLQEIDGFASARARSKARLANPSELYGGAYELANGLDRNRGIGNAVYPDVAEWIGRRIMTFETERRLASLALPVANWWPIHTVSALFSSSAKGNRTTYAPYRDGRGGPKSLVLGGGGLRENL